MPGSWLVSGSWWPRGVRGHSVRGWGELSRPSNYEHKPGRGGDTHCHIFLFAKKAHCYVIPEWRAFCNTRSCNFVFGEGNIKVPVGLHHAACCQDGLKTWEVHNLVILKRLSEWSSLPESRHSVGPSTLVEKHLPGTYTSTGTNAQEEHSRPTLWLFAVIKKNLWLYLALFVSYL